MSNKINEGDFEIAKKHKDFKKSVIARTGLTNEFTIGDMEAHESDLEKSKTTLMAQIKLSDAVIKNIAHFHEHVSNMSDEMLAKAAYLYETKQLVNTTSAKLKEVNATLKKYRLIKGVIYKKFGFVESNILDNEEPQ